jgi:hypothetical protein
MLPRSCRRGNNFEAHATAAAQLPLPRPGNGYVDGAKTGRLFITCVIRIVVCRQLFRRIAEDLVVPLLHNPLAERLIITRAVNETIGERAIALRSV